MGPGEQRGKWDNNMQVDAGDPYGISLYGVNSNAYIPEDYADYTSAIGTNESTTQFSVHGVSSWPGTELQGGTFSAQYPASLHAYPNTQVQGHSRASLQLAHTTKATPSHAAGSYRRSPDPSIVIGATMLLHLSTPLASHSSSAVPSVMLSEARMLDQHHISAAACEDAATPIISLSRDEPFDHIVGASYSIPRNIQPHRREQNHHHYHRQQDQDPPYHYVFPRPEVFSNSPAGAVDGLATTSSLVMADGRRGHASDVVSIAQGESQQDADPDAEGETDASSGEGEVVAEGLNGTAKVHARSGASGRTGKRANTNRVDESTPAKKKKRSKMHRCELCRKEFPRPSGLATHMNGHRNEKPFRCSFLGCSRSFTVSSNAKRHLRTHGVQPTSRAGAVRFTLPVVA